ncbi:unnamed protein product [Mytilus coruscus]|uniref:Uncharacterized protein n=1 Tax=Mytilus coruscus TaxID=42192 RepID=A0A6J8DPI9_MYTCO|nr:unnamed protein product [Mytilus coruscus]
MRSEGSDAYVEEDTSSVLEDNVVAFNKVTSAPGKKGNKRTSSRSTKDNLMARIEEQDKQCDSMSTINGAEGPENSRNSDHDDVNTSGSRSDEWNMTVKYYEHERFQKYLTNRNEKSCETEKQDKTVSHTLEAAGNLLDILHSDTPNLDSAIQNVRDIFTLSTKCLDQTARRGAFHHMVRSRATMYDTGLNELRDYANSILTLPLTADGSQLGKRNPTATVTSESTNGKKPKYDNCFKIPKKNFKFSGKQTPAANKTWVSYFSNVKKGYSSLRQTTNVATSDTKGNSFAYYGTNFEIRNVSEDLNESAQYGKRLTNYVGFDSFLHRIDPHCTPIYEAYPITSTSFLDNLDQRSHLSNSIYTTLKISIELVVGQRKHYQGQIITPVVGNTHNNN